MHHFDINELVRKNIQTLTPYQSARRIGGQGDVWLNANEYPVAPNYQLDVKNLNRYPQPQPQAVINRYAAYAGVNVEQVIISRGADEAIELLMRGFCEPGQDSIIYCPPTYGMYQVSAQTLGINAKAIPLKADWQLDLPAIENNLAMVKLIYICSPNNPTGNLLNQDDIRALLKLTEHKALVIVDEAYIEFSAQASVINLLDTYPHLVILRTLSKAFALAGLRCGFTLANRAIIEVLLKVIAPYPLPTPVADIAAQALSTEGINHMKSNVMLVITQKNKLTEALSTLSVVETVYTGFGNYLLVRFKPNSGLFKTLWQNGIIVRDQDKQIGLKDCVRITIGTQAECDRLLQAIELNQ